MKLKYPDMMIHNYSVDNLSAIEEDKRNFVLSEIEKRTARMKSKQEQIDMLTYEKTLIEEDVINIVKTDLAYCDTGLHHSYDILDKCFKYHCTKHKEKNDDTKRYFDYMVSNIQEKFFGKDKSFKLVNISNYNFDSSYDFSFKYKGEIIQIGIPNFAAANSKNYIDLLVGYTATCSEGEHYWRQFSRGFDIKKIAEDIAEWKKKVDEKKKKGAQK